MTTSHTLCPYARSLVSALCSTLQQTASLALALGINACSADDGAMHEGSQARLVEARAVRLLVWANRQCALEMHSPPCLCSLEPRSMAESLVRNIVIGCCDKCSQRLDGLGKCKSSVPDHINSDIVMNMPRLSTDAADGRNAMLASLS